MSWDNEIDEIKQRRKLAKQQGGKEKAAEAMKFWNNSLLQEKVTEIAKAIWKK